MTLFKKTLLLVSLAAMVFALAVQPAGATTYTLSQGNAAISGYGGPYGTVAVTVVDPNTATITFTALSAGGYNFLFGNGGSVALNVTGTGIGYSNVTGINQPQAQGAVCNAGNGFCDPIFNYPNSPTSWQVSQWGTFNFVLNNFDGFNYAFSTLTFTLTNTSGNWLNDADVLTPNAGGNFMASHIFIANQDWSNTGVTGFATTPDGGMTISLLGLALAGMGLVARRKK